MVKKPWLPPSEISLVSPGGAVGGRATSERRSKRRSETGPNLVGEVNHRPSIQVLYPPELGWRRDSGLPEVCSRSGSVIVLAVSDGRRCP